MKSAKRTTDKGTRLTYILGAVSGVVIVFVLAAIFISLRNNSIEDKSGSYMGNERVVVGRALQLARTSRGPFLFQPSYRVVNVEKDVLNGTCNDTLGGAATIKTRYAVDIKEIGFLGLATSDVIIHICETT